MGFKLRLSPSTATCSFPGPANKEYVLYVIRAHREAHGSTSTACNPQLAQIRLLPALFCIDYHFCSVRTEGILRLEGARHDGRSTSLPASSSTVHKKLRP